MNEYNLNSDLEELWQNAHLRCVIRGHLVFPKNTDELL